MNHQHLYGISTYDYPFACGNHPEQCPEHPFTHFDFLDRAHELGVQCVQIADNLPLTILGAEELAALKAKAEDYGILIETGMRGIDPETIGNYLDITAALNAPLLRNVPGIREEDPVTIDDVYEILKDFLPVLKERNIVFGIENHDKFTAAEYEELIQKLGDPHFGIVLDTTNSLSIEEPLDTVIRYIAQYCVCLHLKDYQINRFNCRMGLQITGQCTGKGRLNIPHLYREVCRRSQYDFNIILESWMAPCETLEASLAQEDEWVKAGVQYVRNLIADPESCPT